MMAITEHDAEPGNRAMILRIALTIVGFVVLLFLVGMTTGFVAAMLEGRANHSFLSYAILTAMIGASIALCWVIWRFWPTRALSDDAASGSGEARLNRRRRSFWNYCLISVVIAMVVGMVNGVGAIMVERGQLTPWLLVAVGVLTLGGFTWFTRDYLRRIDELDLLDNLWACLIGFYCYIVALPSWYFLHDIGLVPEPDQYIIYAAILIVTTLAYLFRKLGWR